MIGVDIVKISRIKRLIAGQNRNSFLRKVFTGKELSYCKDNANHLATTFAAKEAVWKAVSNEKIDLRDIEITRLTNGKPEAKVKGLKKKVEISLSFDGSYAVSFAVIH